LMNSINFKTSETLLAAIPHPRFPTVRRERHRLKG
jgi:hypothetical protein